MVTPSKEGWSRLVNAQKSQVANNAPDKNRIESYYFIFNCFTNEIEYVNASFEVLTNYLRYEFTIEKLLEIIHPDDMEYFLASEQRGLEFTNKLLFNQHFRYQMSYSYRVKTHSGCYIRIRQQCQAIEVNSRGHLTKTFVMHQKVEDKFDPVLDYRVFDKVANRYVDTKNFYDLTAREQEILELIQNGQSSVAIAEKLNVSKHTIDTHRKNILNKTNAANFMELVNKLNAVS